MQYKDKGFLCNNIICKLALLCFMACVQTSNAQESFIFSFPTIPDSLTTVGLRADYLVTHYWDKAYFPNTLSSTDCKSIEQAWVNYCDLFRLADEHVVRHSLSKLTVNDAYPSPTSNFLMSLAEKYFFDTDSPYSNDNLYLDALNAFLTRQDVDSLLKERYSLQLQILTACCEGAKATDFSFKTNSGTSTLHQLTSPFVLLLFYDSECDHCRFMLNELETNLHVASLLSEGKLFILSVNVGGESNNMIKPHTHVNWIDSNETMPHITFVNYDLRTLPLFLLLNSDKKIVTKWTNVSNLNKELRSFL
ncbi:MAG: DUF5106 domain-containing protein [Phocaeicola sp.]|nr:DUF5106 domain-containing protein [Phocaeicola sp.]MDY5939020.1 DUF5106 domain-containing protein [Phocaeicola sp.]